MKRLIPCYLILTSGTTAVLASSNVNATNKRKWCHWNEAARKMQCSPETISCGLPDDERTGLFLVVRCFAGSTALEGVLMSSKNIATTCSSKQWQCEPQRAKDYSYTGPSRKRLGAIAPYLDMKRKVFLLNKVLPCSNLERATSAMASDLWFLRQRDQPLPSPFIAAGISAVNPVVVIMWSPPCVLNRLSSHAHKAGTNGRAFRKISDEFSIVAAAFHQKLALSSSVSTGVVVNYADLLWQRGRLLTRLVEAVPCLGSHLNGNYVPRIGVDIFPENKFKPRGSVASFSRNHDPVDCCGYNVSMGTCMHRSERFEDGETAVLLSAIAYLHEHSLLAPPFQLKEVPVEKTVVGNFANTSFSLIN
mmetsp:Transcript_15931/g.32645  ORF Transcript_15931/g.32645 Transcript_15931/m.32645 type:complete len:362 (+) Transcript_15931:32-1117(+)